MTDDILPADPVAAEIHARFLKKMEPRGHLDKILNGNQPIEKRPPLSDAEIAVMRRNIDAQMAEYATAIDDAVAWFDAWKAKKPKGFRAARRRARGE